MDWNACEKHAKNGQICQARTACCAAFKDSSPRDQAWLDAMNGGQTRMCSIRFERACRSMNSRQCQICAQRTGCLT